MAITFTGERVIPGQMPDTRDVQAHAARYIWAMHPFCRGKIVLDAACGSGYGTMILGWGAQRVMGIDRDKDAIEYAEQTYGSHNVFFEQCNVYDLCKIIKPRSIDVVVSFETIEHLDHPEAFMASVWNVLKPGGTLVCSAPWNSGSKYHFMDYTKEMLQDLLYPYFDSLVYYVQDLGQETMIRKEDKAASEHPTHIYVGKRRDFIVCA